MDLFKRSVCMLKFLKKSIPKQYFITFPLELHEWTGTSVRWSVFFYVTFVDKVSRGKLVKQYQVQSLRVSVAQLDEQIESFSFVNLFLGVRTPHKKNS